MEYFINGIDRKELKALYEKIDNESLQLAEVLVDGPNFKSRIGENFYIAPFCSNYDPNGLELFLKGGY